MTLRKLLAGFVLIMLIAAGCARTEKEEPSAKPAAEAAAPATVSTPGPAVSQPAPGPKTLKRGDAPLLDILIEPATLFCLSFQVTASADPELSIQTFYKQEGAETWSKGLDLSRVDPHYVQATMKPGEILFAGSILELTEDTAYQVELIFMQGEAELGRHKIRTRTWKEPAAPNPKRTLYVRPGSGGGDGSKDSPFLGTATADKAARPGDLMLLQAGVYKGAQKFTRSGRGRNPIVWRAEGEVIFDGEGAGCVVPAGNLAYVFFEGIHIRNGKWGMTLHHSNYITLKRMHFSGVKTGISANYDQKRIFVADSVFKGTLKWTEKPRNFEPRGIEIAGQGHVIMHNRFSDFRDAIDTRSVHQKSNFLTYAVDFCYNDISFSQDDGIEHDFSFCNTRTFYNRLTNCGQGITFQPIFGGPVYCFRNTLYNIRGEPFKLHSNGKTTSHGAIIMHNTVFKQGMATHVYCSDPISSFFLFNNLYVGTEGKYAAEYIPPNTNSFLDGNVYVGRFKQFLKWNKKRYDTIEDLREDTGMEKSGVYLISSENIFAAAPHTINDPKADAAQPGIDDLRIRADAPFVDKAILIPSVNDNFRGEGPDAGAFEAGDPLPHYGPRPE